MKKALLLMGVLFLAACGSTPQLEDILLDDPFLGPEDAAIVVVEYSDFQCPYCAAANGDHEQLVQQFILRDATWKPAVPYLKEQAEQGNIKFVFKHYPLAGHKYALIAAQAAEAASNQGKFWEYHDLLYRNQDKLTKKDLIRYAELLGLDVEQFTLELESEAHLASVKLDMAEGQKLGVTGTPAFFVNGQLLAGAQPASAFAAALS